MDNLIIPPALRHIGNGDGICSLQACHEIS
jgi:hypothetical protein